MDSSEESRLIYDESLIPMTLLNESGFLLFMPPEVERYADLFGSLPIDEKIRNFVLAIIDGVRSESDLGGYTSHSRIIRMCKKNGLASGSSVIYSRIKGLKEIGLLNEMLFTPPGRKRKSRIFILNQPLIDTKNVPEEYLITESEGAHIGRKKAADTEIKLRGLYSQQMLNENQNRHYRDSLMSSFLSKCVRLDDSDDRKIIKTTFSHKSTPINVKTTTLTDGNITISSDLRYVMVLTSIAIQIMTDYLKSAQKPEEKMENYFIIDLNDMADYVGNLRTTGNRQTVYRSLRRMYQTNFEISTVADSEFANNFLTGYNEVNYRFLSDFKAVVEDATESDDMFSEDLGVNIESIKNPRWVRISLWPETFDSMWNYVVNKFYNKGSSAGVHYFIQNPGVVRNKSTTLYHLFSHLSSWVGVSGNRRKTCTSIALHEYMLPSSRYQNFLRSLLAVFNNTKKDSEPKITNNTEYFSVNVFGYIVEGRKFTKEELSWYYPRKGFNFTFYRDVNDKYIGNGSRHNKLSSESSRNHDTKAEGDNLERTELGCSSDSQDIPNLKVIVDGDDGPGMETISLFENED